jgi:hypothetical protein
MRGATLQRVLPAPRRRDREIGREGKRRRQGEVEEHSRAVAPLLPSPRALFNRPRRWPRRGPAGPRAEAERGRVEREGGRRDVQQGRGGKREN